MVIYIVQPGDNIFNIAAKFNVTVTKLIQDNGLQNPNGLVPGQTIVITYAIQTHTVQEGDTLLSIANAYDITVMQLLRNNSFLSERENIYPGETLTIKYNTSGQVAINGYAYPYINKSILTKTLPYLTYLSVFNYRIVKAGEIISYGDDAEVVQLAKYYSTIPLMMVSTLSPQGEPAIDELYEILSNKDYFNTLHNNFLNILQSTNYMGVNIMISGINIVNQNIYIDLLTDLSNFLRSEGYLFYLTINPNLFETDDGTVIYEKLDYQKISELASGIVFLQYVWGAKFGPPAPVCSIYQYRAFAEYVVSLAPPEKITLGKPLIGYDWEYPFILGRSFAYSLTLDGVITLAHEVGAVIQFDEKSQTPFFTYTKYNLGGVSDHIVWFIDARSIDALQKLNVEYGLVGSGIWNIMIYYQQIWSLINSQYDIIKLI